MFNYPRSKKSQFSYLKYHNLGRNSKRQLLSEDKAKNNQSAGHISPYWDLMGQRNKTKQNQINQTDEKRGEKFHKDHGKFHNEINENFVKTF